MALVFFFHGIVPLTFTPSFNIPKSLLTKTEMFHYSHQRERNCQTAALICISGLLESINNFVFWYCNLRENLLKMLNNPKVFGGRLH